MPLITTFVLSFLKRNAKGLIVGVVAIAAVAYSYYYVGQWFATSATKAVKQEYEEKIRVINEAHATSLTKANANAAKLTEQHKLSLAALEKTLDKELARGKELSNKLRDLNSRGGLSIPTKGCKPPSDSSSPTSVAGTSKTEARAELTPEASSTLIDLVERGDEAIIKLNELVDFYEKVRIKGCGVPTSEG